MEVIFPHRIEGIPLDRIVKRLQERRQKTFGAFVKGILGLPDRFPPERILALRELLREAEMESGKTPGGGPVQKGGVREFLEMVFHLFSPPSGIIHGSPLKTSSG